MTFAWGPWPQTLGLGPGADPSASALHIVKAKSGHKKAPLFYTDVACERMLTSSKLCFKGFMCFLFHSSLTE